MLRDIREGQNRLEKKFDEQVSAINERLLAVENRLEDNCVNQVEVNLLKDHISILESKIDDLENRNRRDNLIIFGIKESDKETWADTEKITVDWIADLLEVDVENKIERAHRIGGKGNKERPIIVKFSSFRTKEEVWNNKTKLKQTNFRISEDFSLKVRKQRSTLWKWGESERNDGKKTYLKFNKLQVGDKEYKVDDRNEVYEITHRNGKAPKVARETN